MTRRNNLFIFKDVITWGYYDQYVNSDKKRCYKVIYLFTKQ